MLIYGNFKNKFFDEVLWPENREFAIELFFPKTSPPKKSLEAFCSCQRELASFSFLSSILQVLSIG